MSGNAGGVSWGFRGVRGTWSVDAAHGFAGGDVGSVGAAGDPVNGFVLGMPCAGSGFVPVLSDAQGRVLRLRDWQQCPHAGALVLFPEQCPGWMQGPLELVYYLYDERDVRLEDQVAGFLVECARRVVGDYGQDEVSVVVCRPGVAETLDLQSDAFMPVCGVYGDGLAHGHVPQDGLRGLVCAGGDALAGEHLTGCLYGWAEQGCAYEAVVLPRPYQRRPECTVVVDWAGGHGGFDACLDLLGEQDAGFLCFAVRRCGADLDLVVHGHDGDDTGKEGLR